MTAYAEINAQGEVLQQLGRIDPPDFVGPDDPIPDNSPGCTYRKLTENIGWGARPSESHKLLWPAEAPAPGWVETLTLEQLKLRKRAEITAQRLRADADHFVYLEKAIRTADKDMIDLFCTNGYIALFGEFDADWPGGWKAIDDSYLIISTIDEWKAFYRVMYRTGIANFRKSQELKARIDAATTSGEVEAIQWAATPEPVEPV